MMNMILMATVIICSLIISTFHVVSIKDYVEATKYDNVRTSMVRKLMMVMTTITSPRHSQVARIV